EENGECKKLEMHMNQQDNLNNLYQTARCTVIRHKKEPEDPSKRYMIRIKEDDVKVMEFPLLVSKSPDLSVVLAMDISGSMDQVFDKKANRKRIDQAKQAAGVFFQKLPPSAQC